MRAALLGLLGLLLAGCVTPLRPVNQPLAEGPDGVPDFDANYGLAPYVRRVAEGRLTSPDAAGSDILLFVTFSGGGKRSAAFAHGALRGLRDIPLHRPDGRKVTMLNALDYLAGVSGGSFPAAHFGLYRDKSFETFPAEFLHVDINAYIWGIYLLPWNWEWIANPGTGTNDYMARVYDQLMFHGATFADLAKRGRPIVSITATDIANGATFPFLGTNFGLLCSDLNSYPIADAVAASNAFPGLFSPVNLKSYAARCHGKRPPLAAKPSVTPPESETAAARRRELARLQNIYADPDRTKWVHLSDGGIADNLAMRGLLNFFIVLQAQGQLFHEVALGTRRILVVSVDGEASNPSTLGQQHYMGGLLQVISAASGAQIDAYNFETLALAREQVRHLADRIRAERCAAGPVINGHPCDDVKGELVHLALSDIRDPLWRERLSSIPTGLTIPDEDADALVRYGEALVRDDAVINRVAAEADFPPPGPAVVTRPGLRASR
ncbi:MAG: patatin-like phospholipase family protein [Proteobacteria bacterium]|nr:patatin-like phospholipase family protein [Pseudomonadota bacterium]